MPWVPIKVKRTSSVSTRGNSTGEEGGFVSELDVCEGWWWVSGDQSTLQVDRRSSFFFFFTVDYPSCESTLVALFIMLLMGANGRAAPTVTKLFSHRFWERCSLQKQEVYCSWTHLLASTSFSAQLAAEKAFTQLPALSGLASSHNA
jgi:hypothetical protein